MTDGEEPVFAEPWEAKTFALAVVLHQRGVYSWPEWAERLGSRIRTAEPTADGDDASGHYCNWLDALEDILTDKNVITPDEIARWREAWRRAAARTPHGIPIEVGSQDF